MEAAKAAAVACSSRESRLYPSWEVSGVHLREEVYDSMGVNVPWEWYLLEVGE